VLTLELLSLDTSFAAVLRGRLADRGHRVRLRSGGPSRSHRTGARDHHDPADLVIVASGQRPIARTNVDDLVHHALPHGRDALDVPLVLVASIDPTAEAVAALYERGFDAVLGAGAQRDVERHLEAVVRLVERNRQRHSSPPEVRAAKPSAHSTVAAARALDVLALRKAARAWWSLESLEDEALRDTVRDLADDDCPVLVRGERGAGRRHVARCLHEVGEREGGFVEVGCDRLTVEPSDLEERLGAVFDLARAGTVCLTNLVGLRDDRARLLRAMAERHPSTRIVCTVAPVATPAFGFADRARRVDVPPLRERPDAVRDAVRRMLRVEPTERATAALLRYEWPGNFEELEAVLARLAADRPAGRAADRPGERPSERVDLRDLPPVVRAAYVDGDELVPQEPRVPQPHEWRITDDDPIDWKVYERKLFLRALAAAKGNRATAAEILKLGRSTVYRKLRDT
jgi:DNA-binding NtrC family response regulator